MTTESIYHSAYQDELLAQNARDYAAMFLLKRAATQYSSISDYKDAAERSTHCSERAAKLSEKLSAKYPFYNAPIAVPKHSPLMSHAKRLICAVLCISVIILGVCFLTNTVITPIVEYNEALELNSTENYEKAGSMFIRLGDYRNASDMRIKCQDKSWVKGNTVLFGAYEQDNNKMNGKEPIEWIVLDRDDEKGAALLISKYPLDCLEFNSTGGEVTWEDCTLRHWLNNDFISEAFSSSESELIEVRELQNTNFELENSECATPTTNDKVFLLSLHEVLHYFPENTDRHVAATEYAKARGALVNKENGKTWWWLRTTGGNGCCALIVGSVDAQIDYRGFDGRCTSTAVRPALWVKTN